MVDKWPPPVTMPFATESLAASSLPTPMQSTASSSSNIAQYGQQTDPFCSAGYSQNASVGDANTLTAEYPIEEFISSDYIDNRPLDNIENRQSEQINQPLRPTASPAPLPQHPRHVYGAIKPNPFSRTSPGHAIFPLNQPQDCLPSSGSSRLREQAFPGIPTPSAFGSPATEVPPPPSPSMSTRLVTSAAISPLTPAITDSFFNEAARASSQSDFDSEGEDNPEFEPEPGDVDVQQQDEQQQQFASKGKERQEPTSSSPRKDDVDKPPPPKRKRGRPPLPKPEPGSNIIPGSRRLPHNQVERKYREGLNAQLERLRHAVPTLPQGENVAQKPSKAMVLAAAIEYIHGLENERDTLLDEVEQLRNMLSGGGRPMQPSGWAGRGFAGRGYGSRGYGWRRGT